MRSSVWTMVAATILITTASSCTQVEVRHEPVELEKAEKPLLPAIKPAEMMCLSDDAYARIVERDRLRRNYGEELEAIIDANNAGVSDAR